VLPAERLDQPEIDMQPIINHRFLLARRRAARYGIGLEAPAYVRKHLTPKVEIGSNRDPAMPIEISPSIHTPPRRRLDRYDVVGVIALACFVCIFFVGA
jgi:hypothetical protein